MRVNIEGRSDSGKPFRSDFLRLVLLYGDVFGGNEQLLCLKGGVDEM